VVNAIEQQQKSALVIDHTDNVAVALTDLNKGDTCLIRFNDREELITVQDDVSFGHKFALCPIDKDAPVLKYGEEIGRMSEAIEKGQWIHNHNMYCERGRNA
jgi:altronate dehydratase small subunit